MSRDGKCIVHVTIIHEGQHAGDGEHAWEKLQLKCVVDKVKDPGTLQDSGEWK